MTKTISIIVLIFVLLCVSCTQKNKLEDFKYLYTIENEANFKLEFQVKSDSTFSINQFNYFFDNFERKKKPIIKTGKMQNKDFAELCKLLINSDLYKMEDSYGFDDTITNGTDSSISYMVAFSKNGDKELPKFITVNASSSEVVLPLNFIKLIKFTNQFIEENQNM